MKKIAIFSVLLLLAIGLLIGGRCGCRGGTTKTSKVDPLPEQKDSTVRVNAVNVYIENSGSMNGYINGVTDFKGAIGALLAKLPYFYNKEDVKVRFINTRIDSLTIKNVDLHDFVSQLNLLWSEAKREGRVGKDTKLNGIFRDILEQTDNHTISILFSDCIYSIGKGGVEDLLKYEKSLTMNAFLMKWKNDSVPLATTIVKMKSKFEGPYYPYIGDNFNFPIKMDRPYYICVIANRELLNDFNKNIKLEAGEIDGFENKYVLSSENPKNIYWSVLNRSFNQGRFKTDRKKSNKDYIRGIAGVSLTRGTDNLRFAVAVNFSNVQAENDYICNPENYHVITDNFNVVKVAAFNPRELDKGDCNMVKDANPTHIILLQSTTKKLNNTEVSFVLKKQMPQWINDSHTEDDTHVSKLGGKTFGLKYWVEGISDAYEIIYPDNENYFECSISIK